MNAASLKPVFLPETHFRRRVESDGTNWLATAADLFRSVAHGATGDCGNIGSLLASRVLLGAAVASARRERI